MKKKLSIFCLVCSLLLVFTSCQTVYDNEEKTAEATTQIYKAIGYSEENVNGVIMRIPNEWSKKHDDDSEYWYYYAPDDNFLMVTFDEVDLEQNEITDDYFSYYLEGIEESDAGTLFNLIEKDELTNINNIKFKTATYTQNFNSQDFKIFLSVASRGQEVISFTFAQKQDSEIDYKDMFNEIVNTVSMDKVTEKENELKNVEKSIKDKKSELKSLKKELNELQGKIEEEKSKPKYFSAGKYVIGRDLDEGVYNIKLSSGSGNFFGNCDDYINEIFGGSYGIKEYKNADFVEGDDFQVKGDLVVAFYLVE